MSYGVTYMTPKDENVLNIPWDICMCLCMCMLCCICCECQCVNPISQLVCESERDFIENFQKKKKHCQQL